MKILKFSVLLIVFVMVVSGLYAQEEASKHHIPGWVSKNGYWQIETSVAEPDKNIVYFFNNKNVMVYKEHVQGIVLDLKKRKVKMRLKKALESALTAWDRDLPIQQNRQLLAMLFKK